MRNRGVRRPGLSVLICLAMAVGGALSVLWGAGRMSALGHETPATAAAIGLGLFAGLMGLLLLFNFLWALRLVGALRRGEGVIARWTVAPATFELFRDREEQLRAVGDDNDYRVPRQTPAAGLEILFSEDSVLIGDTFFGLASTGMSRFRGVSLLPGSPSCLAFQTVMTGATNLSTIRIYHVPGTLRIPIAHNAGAAAARVLAHYQDVIGRRTIVKPDFWRRRVRWGLTAALVAGLIAAAGFALEAADAELGVVPLVMAVAGAVSALGGLVLALLASSIGRFQREG